MPLDTVEVLKWLAGFAVGVFSFMLSRAVNRVESDIKEKADGAHMLREIGRLEVQLKEARDARENDIERLERASAEKFSEFSESMRDRLNRLEHNLDQRLNLILQAVNK